MTDLMWAEEHPVEFVIEGTEYQDAASSDGDGANGPATAVSPFRFSANTPIPKPG